MSIEAGDDLLRNRMLRRRISKEKLAEAFKIFKKHKINVYANTMLALPFSTLEQDIASVDFAIKVKPDMPNFSIFMPYPGTDLGDYCARAGIYDTAKEDINYGMRNSSPLHCFSEKERNAQYNLCQLAIVAVKFPFLRNLIINRLIYWRPNKLFFFTHYFFAVSTYGRKIFCFKHTLREYIELIARTLKHYFYDFLSKKSPETGGAKTRAGQGGKQAIKYDRLAELEKCMEAMAKNTSVVSRAD